MPSCFISYKSEYHVLSVLNNFQLRIQFKYDLEHLGKLNLLDVQLFHNEQQLEKKCIENKQTLTSTYIGIPLHQSSGNEALSTIVNGAHTFKLCSNQKYLHEKLHHISQIFHRVNSYPS